MNTKYIRYPLGFIMLAMILTAFYFSGIALFLVSVFFIIITMIEYRNMLKNKNIIPHAFLPEIIGILCAYVFIFSNDINLHAFITPFMLAGVIFSFILTVIKNQKPYLMTSLSTVSAIMLIICGLYIIKLTYFFEEKSADYLILIYFSAILCADFTASIIGKKFPFVHFTPEISPDKTLTGAFAHLITCCLICLWAVKLIHFSPLKSLGLGVIISLFAQFGDLTISTFKRELEIKHSGSLFLNYGGLLDRMDSFLFSAPATYYFLFLTTLI